MLKQVDDNFPRQNKNAGLSDALRCITDETCRAGADAIVTAISKEISRAGPDIALRYAGYETVLHNREVQAALKAAFPNYELEIRIAPEDSGDKHIVNITPRELRS